MRREHELANPVAANDEVTQPLLFRAPVIDWDNVQKRAGQAVGTLGMLAGFSVFVAACMKKGMQDGTNDWLLTAVMALGMGIMGASSRLKINGKTDLVESAQGGAVGAFTGIYMMGWVATGLARDDIGLFWMGASMLCMLPLLALHRTFGGELDRPRPPAPR